MLTDDQARAFAVQLAALRRAYETSSGIERHRCLLSALALCGPLVPGVTDSDYRVPKWLYKAVCGQQAAALRQEHDVHWTRWFMVKEARRRKGLSWPKAYEDVSKDLKGIEGLEGTPRTMRESCRIVSKRNRR
jgi:hypothetical protein